MPSLSAMILAGGHSRRMGTDKALLSRPDGQLLLTRTAQIAQTLTSEVVVITPWPERYKAILPPPTKLLKEQPHQRGPLGGFLQGWADIRSDWCLLLACDLPQLESEPLRRWWEWLQAQPGAAAPSVSEASVNKPDASGSEKKVRAIASLTQCLNQRKLTQHKSAQGKASATRWEPLCGFYHRNCLPDLHCYLNSASKEMRPHHFSFQSWLDPLPILVYDHLPPAILFNCNTAEDWSQIIAK
ncbi:MAG: NTP transferase domain-containing protein [Cyanobacteria bacterium P01_D01_bin.105]